ncbi:MAG: hypothetical protein AB1449_02240 [Chloroflexota bacterium]
MDKDLLAQVSQQVARSFPEMAGVRPTVRKQETGRGAAAQYLLVYKGKAELPGGRVLSRIVRVVIDERGRILRMSTSK